MEHLNYEYHFSYLVNINMYLVLKASKANVQNHPIIKRLFQYRKIFGQLDLIFDNIIKPQIETLMDKQVNLINYKICFKLIRNILEK